MRTSFDSNPGMGRRVNRCCFCAILTHTGLVASAAHLFERKTTAPANGGRIVRTSGRADTVTGRYQKLIPTTRCEISSCGLIITDTVNGSEKLSETTMSRAALTPMLMALKFSVP